MSAPQNEMELKEEEIRAHYMAATEMLMGVDHAPRIATPKLTVTGPEKSPDVAAMQRRFRSTTPGLVTRSMARTEGVRLIDRMATTDDDDPLTSPLQAATAHALRRALAIALADGRERMPKSDRPGADLRRANLAGSSACRPQDTEFAELSEQPRRLPSRMSVFANASAYLLGPNMAAKCQRREWARSRRS